MFWEKSTGGGRQLDFFMARGVCALAWLIAWLRWGWANGKFRSWTLDNTTPLSVGKILYEASCVIKWKPHKGLHLSHSQCWYVALGGFLPHQNASMKQWRNGTRSLFALSNIYWDRHLTEETLKFSESSFNVWEKTHLEKRPPLWMPYPTILY